MKRLIEVLVSRTLLKALYFEYEVKDEKGSVIGYEILTPRGGAVVILNKRKED